MILETVVCIYYRRAYYQGDGPNWDNLKESAGDYNKFKEEKKNDGLPEPIGWGVLIADEVKVVTKIQWNSRNNEYVFFGAVDSLWSFLNLHNSLLLSNIGPLFFFY